MCSCTSNYYNYYSVGTPEQSESAVSLCAAQEKSKTSA